MTVGETRDRDRVLDVVGVGLGPFNLGLAALLDPVPDIDALFFEARPAFSWHPGLMLPGTTLQVPFLADLVTLADPTSRFSFLNYLHEHNRLYRFYFYERFHVPRQEYDAYAGWVAASLPSCRFGHRVEKVEPGGDGTWTIRVTATDRDDSTGDGTTQHVSADGHGGSSSTIRFRARSVVFGVGSRPRVPEAVRDRLGEDVFHAAHYLELREKISGAAHVTVVGSGQSAGEVVADLLQSHAAHGGIVDWFTRGAGFLPMEYSKLGLEHFSPEYTAYFHGLAPGTRDRVRAGQDLLYKGLSAETSERIYDLLYEATIGGDEPPLTYAGRCELGEIAPSPVPGRRWRLTWRHHDEQRTFIRDTDVVVLATGYEPTPLPLPAGFVATDEHGRPEVDLDYRLKLRHGLGGRVVDTGRDDGVAADPGAGSDARPGASSLFIQNGELHTHGVGAPDLGLGAYRGAVIANAVAGREVYPVRERTVFQRFGTSSLGSAHSQDRVPDDGVDLVGRRSTRGVARATPDSLLRRTDLAPPPRRQDDA
ncbi:SidA/IucD/PvdA family monooxygenase [Phytoactinopolyspora alkaliphila]|uniref:L-lysine N6-monooxygenase MbtG n=1 Tax=Phytoactinopolyspora alkaliphila TaxID=1783498 RepID=A0A6N9YIT6_9ACTN|nr:SidA/IucD/PvdA family monooxygenase [Phytoactinopolyspora alkaliphila]